MSDPTTDAEDPTLAAVTDAVADRLNQIKRRLYTCLQEPLHHPLIERTLVTALCAAGPYAAANPISPDNLAEVRSLLFEVNAALGAMPEAMPMTPDWRIKNRLRDMRGIFEKFLDDCAVTRWGQATLAEFANPPQADCPA